MPVTDLRRDTRAVIQSVQEHGDIVYITQHGRPAVVMLGFEQYENLVARREVEQWPIGYFEQTYGSLADDPLERPEQGEYPERETLL